MAREEGRFDIEDSLDAINEKLVRRHPHVFGDGDAETPEDVKRRWDEIKAEEKEGTGPRASGPAARRCRARCPRWSRPRRSPRAPPASASTGRTYRACSTSSTKSSRELAQARATGAAPEEVEGEIGDLLFVIVNLARFLKVDPEQALRKTNRKFRRASARRRGSEAGRQRRRRRRRSKKWKRCGRKRSASPEPGSTSARSPTATSTRRSRRASSRPIWGFAEAS